MRASADTIGRDLARGALAGAAGWWAMDQVLRFLYDQEDPRVRERETAARNGIPALERGAEEIAELLGTGLSERQRKAGGTVLQWVTGIGAGVIYATIHEHLPGHGVRRGLIYGAAFSLLVDEGLIPLLRLAPGPTAFPWQTHARGFVGHLVFGAVTEVVLETLDATR